MMSDSHLRRPLRGGSGVVLGASVAAVLGGALPSHAEGVRPLAPLASLSDAWQQLPPATVGNGAPLPAWARRLAGALPRSTAALLELDFAQRASSPIPPHLRAAMRWVAADSNRCDYARATAAFDAAQAGVDDARLRALAEPGFPGWTDRECRALEFARKMTVDSDSVTDAEFAALVGDYGERQTASMVLLMAYANFQDRLLHCLGAGIEEEDGPLPPLAVNFAPGAFTLPTTPPPAKPLTTPPAPAAAARGEQAVAMDPGWSEFTYEALQKRLEEQRQKPTRLRIPDWEEIARQIPEDLFSGPSDIVWYRIVFGYAPELAVPYEIFMRTAGAETGPGWDRVFGSSLFWVATRAVVCPYCMGHCEMNWEVAGQTRAQIAERSRALASDDWSSFTPGEQRALAFTRALSWRPWNVSHEEIEQLQHDFGPQLALSVALNASRYHYMVRISNGFQLTLERDNVFYRYWNVEKPSEVAFVEDASVPHVDLLSDAQCWKRLPSVVRGAGQPLPNWAKGVAVQLPRTAAAMLQLDLAQRTRSPLDPQLRAKMRWVIARANQCAYSEEYAIADFKRAGGSENAVAVLTGEPAGWPEEDRDPLEFARLLTVAAPTIPDELFARLRSRFGDNQAAAMVLLAAYGNFQDRIVLGLNLPMEAGGPLPPVDVEFAPDVFQFAPFVPPQTAPPMYQESGRSVVDRDPQWSDVPYETLQVRLERQRARTPRLRVPTWDEIEPKVPAAMRSRPTRIRWNLVCYGYVPELAVPWSVATRTLWAECPTDRVVEESLFWIQTRTIGCNYCMGHCEMLLEVAGLGKEEVADRTRRLASGDWSVFPPVEQRAYAYAHKLSRTPWELTEADYLTLESDLGPQKAMATFWWLCRGLYMTRVSDGFQLPLERENVFQQLPPASDAPKSNAPPSNAPR